jgi:hypothetical protein
MAWGCRGDTRGVEKNNMVPRKPSSKNGKEPGTKAEPGYWMLGSGSPVPLRNKAIRSPYFFLLWCFLFINKKRISVSLRKCLNASILHFCESKNIHTLRERYAVVPEECTISL